MKRIDSTQNETVKKMRALKAKKGRDEYGQFLAEGEKCVEEALFSHAVVECIFIHGENHKIATLAHEQGVEVIAVSRPVIEAITSVQTPQNVVACVSIPGQIKPQGELVVALEGVSDPQNVGSIIRSADAVGAAGVIFGAGCADYLNPKSVRASMGSIFHLHLYEGDLAAYLCEFKETGCVVAGHLNGKSEFPACTRICLVIGNESKGVGEEIAKLCDSLYKIPIYGRAESLNASVAAGIMMYKAREKMEKAKEEFGKK
ncbi:MAG: RNA methyltransferase [Eubacteriales bacterium]